MFARALPSCFTVGNLFLGIMSIILAVQNEWKYAAIMVIIGMLLDGLDGRVARMLNTQSEFGKELDSLSDLISFGVAPAIIMYISVFDQVGPEGWLVTAIFPICGALRLARFNVYPGEPGYFIGLPITAAGGILATMALYNEYIRNPYVLMLGMVFLSYLMVSKVRYPAFKRLNIPRPVLWTAPFLLILIVITAFKFPNELPKVMFIPLILYALYGVSKTFRKKQQNGS
ncbi:CDP-diacylglycerol--serine O-phosphatidyltransferase [Hazenella sp. IB182357]|uniref:CDP-diacylglycerol--serine O-phosphatidyltransferase n=1 Tax=Polycladospora coralii TaxID=2771432 RepID=A0A926N923_9BACL|nr:CDP-diacylglycerol--serine O-phosphatidyltransferase [Polycladospora coralii]MBD1372396.1 CDP-diacylglycerol--serine O-phosphatidyltransferase [Polycladospora coralii]MBS7531414.1 CDP-diacylglycerol--serine O-phosphatidyltransferase [Polycladospora coralii]